MMKNNIYSIKNNDDWNNLNENELYVDISNDAYFGFRAMEKNAVNIIYNPFQIDSLIRIIKESKKFLNTKHILILEDIDLSFDSKNSEEKFLKEVTRKIEEIIEVNSKIKLNFIIETNLNKEKIYDILIGIYDNYI